MNITLESDGVHLQTDSSANKLIFKQGTNASLTFAENTGTATFLTAPIHPTPASSANDTQSATTEYVKTYGESLKGGFNPTQSSSISGVSYSSSPIVKASTVSFDYPLTASGIQLVSTDIVFTAVYLIAGIQFNKYNIISAITGQIPLQFGLFDYSGNYVINSDTGSYNSSSTIPGGLLTSTLTNTVTIETTGVYYIFYKSNATVVLNSYYAGMSYGDFNRITNCWRVSGTILSNGPFRSFCITGQTTDTPSTLGNIASRAITTWLGRINFVFLTL